MKILSEVKKFQLMDEKVIGGYLWGMGRCFVSGQLPPGIPELMFYK